MIQVNAPQSSGRRYYISDPKQINEQECYDQGLRNLVAENDEWFEMHWHAQPDHCKYKHEGLSAVRDLNRCYVISKDNIR